MNATLFKSKESNESGTIPINFNLERIYIWSRIEWISQILCQRTPDWFPLHCVKGVKRESQIQFPDDYESHQFLQSFHFFVRCDIWISKFGIQTLNDEFVRRPNAINHSRSARGSSPNLRRVRSRNSPTVTNRGERSSSCCLCFSEIVCWSHASVLIAFIRTIRVETQRFNRF